ncbi:hypothetical protein DPMN_134195 [Dreissena polymorpha]|uniref:Uncharacterized protein n=1 Tax=Dreissena polymorpha TaxID=45954 RepID=A0A9D4FVQ7_DREPO|nr:hypothetical protein DPMN_134195 [Dreissena polymorpha]
MFGIKTIAFTILFKTAQCAMSTLYALENAQVSDKKVLLNLMQCGRLNQKFETAALQFSAIDATECVSLSSSWYDSSVYESGFGYAIKKHNVEDFSEIGGVRYICLINIIIV